MKLNEINPFVRFARKNEISFWENKMYGCDHRIFFVFNGKAKITVNNHRYDVEKGDIIYWRSGQEYSVKDFKNAEITGFNFDFTQRGNHINIPVAPLAHFQDVVEDINFDDAEIFNSHFIIKNAFALSEKFMEIVEEFEKREIYYNERCSAILKDIIFSCARLAVTDHNSKSAKLAQEVISYIRNNYKNNISNSTIAEQFNYHPNYLNSLMLQHTGSSMHRYLLNYRINKAVELLQTTTLSVTKIGEEVGIPDIKHFSKLFKNTLGFPPGYYRKY